MTSARAQSGSGKANTSPGSVLKRIVSTQLPFTGLPLGIWLLLGLALIGLGTLLKRRGRLGGALLAATALFLLQAAAAAGSTPKLTPTEHSFLWAVNQARTQHGSPVVALDRRLLQAARYHSRDMIQRQYFAHGDFARLIETFGVTKGEVGENLGWSASKQDAVDRLIGMWLRSPEHRSILLDPSFANVGVGVVVGPFQGWPQALVVTTDFLDD